MIIYNWNRKVSRRKILKNNIIFYKCKSIDEQLILVMREVLKLGLKNVTIHIPIGKSIDYVIKFFNKRKFKFSLNDSNRHEISLKILDEDKLDYSNVNFYLIYNKIQNKCKFLNSLDVRNNDIVI